MNYQILQNFLDYIERNVIIENETLLLPDEASGLCNLTSNKKIKKYISKHKPYCEVMTPLPWNKSVYKTNYNFGWSLRLAEPRIKWLNKQIEILKLSEANPF